MSKLSHNGPVEETHHISICYTTFSLKKKTKKKQTWTNINGDISCLSSELENL